MITDEVKYKPQRINLSNTNEQVSLPFFLEKRTSKEYTLLPLKKSKISKKQKLIFYNYFICYFIILIFCLPDCHKIFLYIIGITARKILVGEKKTEVSEKQTEHSEKKTGVSEKSTENAVSAVGDKSTELVRKRRNEKAEKAQQSIMLKLSIELLFVLGSTSYNKGPDIQSGPFSVFKCRIRQT